METLTNLGPSAQPQDEEPDDRTLLDGFLADDETSFSIIVKRYEEALTAYRAHSPGRPRSFGSGHDRRHCEAAGDVRLDGHC